jgi:ankyrin repeat protein
LIKNLIIATSLLLIVGAENTHAAANATHKPISRYYQEFIAFLKTPCTTTSTCELIARINRFITIYKIDINDPFICCPVRIDNDSSDTKFDSFFRPDTAPVAVVAPDQKFVGVIESIYDFPTQYHLDDILFYTPLMYAIGSNNVPLVRALLECGAQAWATNERTNPIGWTTPMHLAAHYGLTEIMTLLHAHIQHADLVNQLDAYDHTPLYVAAYAPGLTRQMDTINWLRKHSGTYEHATPARENILTHVPNMHFDVTVEKPGCLTALASQTPASNHAHATHYSTPEMLGNTQLHIAAECLNTRLVEVFLTDGADHTKRNRAGHTPLQSCLRQAKLGVCPYHDTDPESCKRNHWDGTSDKNITDAIEIIKLFLAHGATLTEADLLHVSAGKPEEMIRKEFNDVLASTKPTPHQQTTAAPPSPLALLPPLPTHPTVFAERNRHTTRLPLPPAAGFGKQDRQSDADIADIALADKITNMSLSPSGATSESVEATKPTQAPSDSARHTHNQRCTCSNWLYKLLCCQCCCS